MVGRYPGKLDREKVQALIDRYKRGDTLCQVARHFGVHEDTARRCLRGDNDYAREILGGVSILRGTPFVTLTESQQDEAAALIASGLSKETVARRLRVCRKTIGRALEHHRLRHGLVNTAKPKAVEVVPPPTRPQRETIFTWAKKWEAAFDARAKA